MSSSEAADHRSDGAKIPLQCLALAGVYFLTGTAGLLLATVTRSISLVWPPTGVSLAALLLCGGRLWPGVFLGAFLVNVLTPGVSAFGALEMAAGNTVEAALGAFLLRRSGVHASLERVDDVLRLAILAGMVSTAASASIGTLALWQQGLLDRASVPIALREWWLGDLLSDLIVAPLLLTWAAVRRFQWDRRRVAEGVLLFASLIAVNFLASGILRGGGLLPSPEPYAIFPVLIWAALRFDSRIVTAATFATSAFSIYSTATSAASTFHESLFLLQVFMGVVSVTSLLLAASTAERNRALRIRDDLLAMVSHDLKSPLGVISLSASTLTRAGPSDGAEERAKTSGERIKRSAERMARIIDDLLDVASIEAGRLRLRRDRHSVADLVADTVESLGVLATESELRLVGEAPPRDLTVECDRERIAQVLGNLVGNAIKFTPRGGSITLRAQPEDRGVRFSVSDTGEGIAPDQLGHVWERGWQSRSSLRKGSLGLGLFISKGIVEAHGGKIGFESKVGVGSTFWFTLNRAGR